MKITVSIILLNYNWKKFNKDCIDSILAQNCQDFEIIFVDQCSTDWSLEEVEILYKKEIKDGKIKIVKNPENDWFTWWNNLWVKNADKNSKYICLLNNDTTVPKDWLENLLISIEWDAKLWAVSCNIWNRWMEEKEKKIIYNDYKKYISTIFWEIVYEKMTKDEIMNKFFYTSILWWCCFMYKKSLVADPFPQYYFAYAEDVFLSWYIVNMWYKLWVCLNTYVKHYWSWSFWTKPSQLKLFHWNKNQIINFLVFYPVFYMILLLPLFLIKEIAHLFMWSPLMRIKAKIKAWWWISHNYNKIKITKEKIKINKKISTPDFIKQLSHKLSDPYYVENKVLKTLVYVWNILFTMYYLIIKELLYIFSFRH